MDNIVGALLTDDTNVCKECAVNATKTAKELYFKGHTEIVCDYCKQNFLVHSDERPEGMFFTL